MSNICSVCRKENVDCSPTPLIKSFLCPECRAKQIEFENRLIKAEMENKPILNEVLGNARQIDMSLRVQTDIFNAQTVSIHDLKTAIDADESITDKHFTLARFLSERFAQFQELIIGARTSIIEAETKQRAIQTYYIELSKKLKTEQREQLKLQDLQYKPVEIKTTSTRRVSTKKTNKAELIAIAKESGIPLQILTLLCVTKGLSPKDAAIEFKKIEQNVKTKN